MKLNRIIDILYEKCPPDDFAGRRPIFMFLKDMRDDINLAGECELAWGGLDALITQNNYHDFGEEFEHLTKEVRNHLGPWIPNIRDKYSPQE